MVSVFIFSMLSLRYLVEMLNYTLPKVICELGMKKNQKTLGVTELYRWVLGDIA